ncbi:hypothetical protein [Aromatoleum aromaticum]|uniref:hypothetical protein n=1 Tax=Aromatoleum aromaticum TaxID=551760 RepID=UPI0005A1942A|nr:hypothetical protein [Aromatoleum aromaticum]
MQPTPPVAQLLDSLGLALGTYQVELVDIHQAETAYIHHSLVPVAVVGYAQVSPTFATGRFPKFTFIDLIHKRPSMDEIEARALAAVCGLDLEPGSWSNPEPFGTHLWSMIERFDLGAFFQRVDRPYGSRGEHYYMRPRGFDWSNADNPEISGALDQWRSDYRKLPMYRQLLVATILQLYFQSDDRYWMVRVPKKWHAAEGIEILKTNGALQDWARLYALYPGW